MNKKMKPWCVPGKNLYCFFLISIFLSFSTFQLHALVNDEYVQKKNFTVKVENKTVIDVMNYIEANSEFIFMYTKNLLGVLDKKVSINVEDKNISSIMELLSDETGIHYEIKGRQVTLSNATATTQQQKKGININGTVWDEQGNPLPGVNVILKGTSTGTTTDINGNYFVSVSNKNTVLSFSYIGFETQDVTIGGQININPTFTYNIL